MSQYDTKRIARELIETAQGNTYSGNAIRVAKDIEGLTLDERSVLDRWETGFNTVSDRWALQDIANRIAGCPACLSANQADATGAAN